MMLPPICGSLQVDCSMGTQSVPTFSGLNWEHPHGAQSSLQEEAAAITLLEEELHMSCGLWHSNITVALARPVTDLTARQ